MKLVKLERLERANKCPREMLESQARYYHEGGGREKRAEYYRNIPEDQRARRLASARAWHARNKRRMRVLNIAANTKARVRKFYPGEFDVWELIGCNCAELADYLDTKNMDGMDWKDGKRFEVDHIKPLCAFDLSKIEQLKEAFHFTNLQVIERGKHFDKSRPEHMARMESLAIKWWGEQYGTPYPGFKIAWREFSQSSGCQRRKGAK